MTTEELEAMAQEAREESEKLTEEEQAVVRNAIPKAVH
jgi:hypothetical protein